MPALTRGLPEDLARVLDALGVQPPVAVAFSGGPDSWALLDVASRWAAVHPLTVTGPAVIALHVDHGLRPESAAEAAALAQATEARAIPFCGLRWDHGTAGPPTIRIQASARAARLRLLTQACEDLGLGTLLMAHHRDDQRETVLMRRARAVQGPGLAGMPVVRGLSPAVRLVRPLLGVPKAALVEWCDQQGLPALTDPSNTDPGFERGRVRRTLAGWSAHDLATLDQEIAASGRDRAAAEAALAEDLSACARLDPWGGVVVDLARLGERPLPRRAGVLARLLSVAAQCSPPLAPAVGEALWLRLDRLGSGRRATAGGCVVHRRGETAFIWQDPRRAEPGGVVPAGGLWDRRWRVGPVSVEVAWGIDPAAALDLWPRAWPRPPAARLGQVPHCRPAGCPEAGWRVLPCDLVSPCPSVALLPDIFVPWSTPVALAPDHGTAI